LGLDLGYRAIINEDGTAHIPTITLSLFKWVEISGVFDIQPDIKIPQKTAPQKNDDLLFGLKVQLPTNAKNPSNPAVALGSTLQLINFIDDDRNTNIIYNYTAFQFYVAATYAGSFFNMPAETTVVIGKTAYASGPRNNSNIDFGMGFDLVLFPDVLGNYVHWVIDFANFDYSDNAWRNGLYHNVGGPSWYRGVLNTGFRIDLASIPSLNKYKFVIDVAFNDLFDEGYRSFTVGVVFGIPLL